ncbi:MAG: FecR domain-containing protein [Humidesulfovibrio sp.]|nr:FecR domain-containing protein [Humidesulfovibrio sp.]
MRTDRRQGYGLVVLAMLLLAFAAPIAYAAEASPAGSVKSVTGQALVLRKGAAAASLKAGDRIFEKDVLTTGKASSIGIVMRDNSVLSLGPSSRLVVESFLFAPEKGALAQVLKLSRGSMDAVSGEIVKLNPEAARVETPIYTIGIRGTHFLLNVEPGNETPAEAAEGVEVVK